TFAVDRSWKGAGAEIVITEGYSNCSKIFSLGQQALVYAYNHESRPGELDSDKCGEPRGGLEEQLNALGKPSHVYASTPRPDGPIRRLGRHAYVYALTVLSDAHNAAAAARENPGSPMSVALISVTTLMLVQMLALAILPRLRPIIAAALVATLLV